MKKQFVITSVATVAGALLTAPGAFAQDATATATATTTGGATAGAGVGLPAGRAAAVAGGPDHDLMVGTFAVGYLGRRTVAYGTGSALDLSAARAVAQAPVIGARYWITPLLGIDAGFGLAIIDDGKTNLDTNDPTLPNGEIELAPVTAFLFHAGVPLALSNVGHFSFQVVPEVNVGFASQKVQPAPDTEDKSTGLTFDVGARGGAEVHFGFIGVPQLSLQGSIGLLYRYEQWKVESSTPANSGTYKEHRGNFSTTVYDNPWNIFTSNVAALYYF